MKPDGHAVNVQQVIHSLCFDNLEDKALREKLDGVMYSEGFGTTLIALTMITSIVIFAVTSNVVLSLGMVGALSIVRFRTSIKDPLDIAFLFWSIGAGIILATGMIPLAVIGSVCIGLILLVFVNQKSHTHPYMIILNCENHDTEVKSGQSSDIEET